MTWQREIPLLNKSGCGNSWVHGVLIKRQLIHFKSGAHVCSSSSMGDLVTNLLDSIDLFCWVA